MRRSGQVGYDIDDIAPHPRRRASEERTGLHLGNQGWRSLVRSRVSRDGLSQGAAAAGQAAGNAATILGFAGAGLASAGHRLPYFDQLQNAFFPHDLSGVTAHTDPAARRAARTLGADAYTMGEHVAFGAEPDLATAAHEVTHVLQQRGTATQTRPISARSDPAEREARSVADAVVAGLQVAHVHAHPAAAVCLQETCDPSDAQELWQEYNLSEIPDTTDQWTQVDTYLRFYLCALDTEQLDTWLKFLDHVKTAKDWYGYAEAVAKVGEVVESLEHGSLLMGQYLDNPEDRQSYLDGAAAMGTALEGLADVFGAIPGYQVYAPAIRALAGMPMRFAEAYTRADRVLEATQQAFPNDNTSALLATGDPYSGSRQESDAIAAEREDVESDQRPDTDGVTFVRETAAHWHDIGLPHRRLIDEMWDRTQQIFGEEHNRLAADNGGSFANSWEVREAAVERIYTEYDGEPIEINGWEERLDPAKLVPFLRAETGTDWDDADAHEGRNGVAISHRLELGTFFGTCTLDLESTENTPSWGNTIFDIEADGWEYEIVIPNAHEDGDITLRFCVDSDT